MQSPCADLSLETSRLRLRQFREDDLDVYARITADPEVMRYVGGRPLDRDEARRSLGYVVGHWRIRGYGLWAVDEKASGALVGRVGLYHPAGWPGIEVGWLMDRARWREGFASEGGAAAMHHGFDTLGASHLISVIESSNLASIRVAEKLGECFERHMQLQGRPVCIYGIGCEAFQARRAG